MNNLLICSAIFVGAILLSGCAGQEQTCDEAAKTIAARTKEFHEPKGLWSVYKSSKDDKKCTTLTYTPLNVNGSHFATAVFTSSDPATKVEGVISIVPGDTNQYVFVDTASGKITLYHRLNPEVPTEDRHFFCSFTCDAAGKFVDTFTCYVDDDAIKPQVDKIILGAKLPFAPDHKMTDINEKCPKV